MCALCYRFFQNVDPSICIQQKFGIKDNVTSVFYIRALASGASYSYRGFVKEFSSSWDVTYSKPKKLLGELTVDSTPLTYTKLLFTHYDSTAPPPFPPPVPPLFLRPYLPPSVRRSARPSLSLSSVSTTPCVLYSLFVVNRYMTQCCEAHSISLSQLVCCCCDMDDAID